MRVDPVVTRTRMRRLLLLSMLAACCAASPASAQRDPRPLEQQALTGAMMIWASYYAPDWPLACLRWRFEVSTVDGRYAIVTNHLRVLHRCDRWRSNGTWLLHRTPAWGWRVVFEGSDPPLCSQFPPRVTRDLFGVACLRL